MLFAIVPGGMMGVVTNLVPMARDQGVDANAAALLITIFALSSFTSKLCFAVVADRLPPRALYFSSA